jgi:hypothetical protein
MLNLSHCLIKYIEKLAKLNNYQLYEYNIELSNKNNSNNDKTKSKLNVIIDIDDSSWQYFTGYDSYKTSMGGEWHLMKQVYFYLNKDANKYDIRFTLFFDGTMPIHYDSFELTNKHKSDYLNAKEFFKNPNNNRKISNSFMNEFIQISIAKLNKNRKYDKQLQCFQTVNNHQKEIIEFLKVNKCDCLITNNFDLISLVMMEKFRNSLTNLRIGLAAKWHRPSNNICLIRTDVILHFLQMNENQFKWFSFLMSNQIGYFLSAHCLNHFYKRMTDFDQPTEESYMDHIREMHVFILKFGMTIDHKPVTKTILKSISEYKHTYINI